MPPVNRLLKRLSASRAVRLVNSPGISPVNRLSPRRNQRSLERPPRAGDIVPVRFRPVSGSPMTRWGDSKPRITPSHSPMGVSTDQFSEPLPASVSRALSSTSQSDTRPGLLDGSGTAVPLAHETALLWAYAGRSSTSAVASSAIAPAATVGSAGISFPGRISVSYADAFLLLTRTSGGRGRRTGRPW